MINLSFTIEIQHYKCNQMKFLWHILIFRPSLRLGNVMGSFQRVITVNR